MAQSGTQSNLTLGLEIVKKATEHDRAFRYDQAYYLYQMSLDFLRLALQAEVSPEDAPLVDSKIREYETRGAAIRGLTTRGSAAVSLTSYHMSSNESGASPVSTHPRRPIASVPSTSSLQTVQFGDSRPTAARTPIAPSRSSESVPGNGPSAPLAHSASARTEAPVARRSSSPSGRPGSPGGPPLVSARSMSPVPSSSSSNTPSGLRPMSPVASAASATALTQSGSSTSSATSLTGSATFNVGIPASEPAPRRGSGGASSQLVASATMLATSGSFNPGDVSPRGRSSSFNVPTVTATSLSSSDPSGRVSPVTTEAAPSSPRLMSSEGELALPTTSSNERTPHRSRSSSLKASHDSPASTESPRHRKTKSTSLTRSDPHEDASELYRQAKEEEKKGDTKKAMALYKQAAEEMLAQRVAEGTTALSAVNDSSHRSDKKKNALKTHSVVVDFTKDEVDLHERLGGGGSGATVYRASISGFTFAAKVLPSDHVEEVIEAIKREIQICENLDHQNVVRYLGHDLSRQNEIRLFLELYSKTLHDVMLSRKRENRPFSVAEVSQLMFQIAKGLNYLHTLSPQIIHRDLKSENIFVTLNSQGNVSTLKIGDFDSSRMLTSSKVVLTMNQGTEGFMAPEICSTGGRPVTGAYTEKVDIWSFGMVMFELMALEKPYWDVAPAKKWEMSVAGEAPNLPQEAQRRYSSLLELWLKCLHKNPSKRPSARKLIKKLSEM